MPPAPQAGPALGGLRPQVEGRSWLQPSSAVSASPRVGGSPQGPDTSTPLKTLLPQTLFRDPAEGAIGFKGPQQTDKLKTEHPRSPVPFETRTTGCRQQAEMAEMDSRVEPF